MTLYFAYGSNMDRAGMARRCARATARGPARLEGYRFFVTRDGYASVARASGACVHGVLWRLAAGDLAALDAYEGVAHGLYRAARLPVRLAEGRVVALVYLACRRQPGRPRPGYMESVVAAARDWGLPDDYVASLARAAPVSRAAIAGQ